MTEKVLESIVGRHRAAGTISEDIYEELKARVDLASRYEGDLLPMEDPMATDTRVAMVNTMHKLRLREDLAPHIAKQFRAPDPLNGDKGKPYVVRFGSKHDRRRNSITHEAEFHFFPGQIKELTFLYAAHFLNSTEHGAYLEEVTPEMEFEMLKRQQQANMEAARAQMAEGKKK